MPPTVIQPRAHVHGMGGAGLVAVARQGRRVEASLVTGAARWLQRAWRILVTERGEVLVSPPRAPYATANPGASPAMTTCES